MQRGFTLIELLVVIALLGALAAVVILNVGPFAGEGECEAYCVEKHNLQTAVAAYLAEHEGSGSTTLSDLDPYLTGGTDGLHYGWVVDDIVDGVVRDPTQAPHKPDGCDCG